MNQYQVYKKLRIGQAKKNIKVLVVSVSSGTKKNISRVFRREEQYSSQFRSIFLIAFSMSLST